MRELMVRWLMVGAGSALPTNEWNKFYLERQAG